VRNRARFPSPGKARGGSLPVDDPLTGDERGVYWASPVIGYDHGGVGEILDNLFARGRVPVHDQGAVVQRIEAFMHEPPTPEARDAYPLSRRYHYD